MYTIKKYAKWANFIIGLVFLKVLVNKVMRFSVVVIVYKRMSVNGRV